MEGIYAVDVVQIWFGNFYKYSTFQNCDLASSFWSQEDHTHTACDTGSASEKNKNLENFL
jgi:hypothetical protein